MHLLHLHSPLPLHHKSRPITTITSPLPSLSSLLPKSLTLVKRSHISVTSRHYPESYDQQRFPSQPQPPGGGAQLPRVFVGHSIYKGKAALQVEPRAPEFTPLDSGAYKLSKEGILLLQFAPAVGTRQYDWNRKQMFSLSVAEIGNLMCLGAKDSCEFYHDPFKGKSEEGKIRKVLKVEPLPDGTGYFFNLSVQNRIQNVDESIYIPITKAELTVLNSAFNVLVNRFNPAESDENPSFLDFGLVNLISLSVGGKYPMKLPLKVFMSPAPTFGCSWDHHVSWDGRGDPVDTWWGSTKGYTFIIPYLLGWHAFTNSIRPEDSIRSSNFTRSGAEVEWGR